MKIGIIVALPEEAQTILPTAVKPQQIYSLGGNAWLAISGMGAANAEQACKHLLATGVDGLLSWGLAGGLNPVLTAGTVLVPQKVIELASARTEAKRPPSYAVDKEWRKAILALLQPQWPVCAEPLVSVDSPAGNRALKQQLHEHTKACAVDMESAAIGRCAAQAGKAFAVLRIVADPAQLALPSVLQRSISTAGQIERKKLIAGLLLRPHQIPPFIRLAGQSRKALAMLKHVGDLLKADLMAELPAGFSTGLVDAPGAP